MCDDDEQPAEDQLDHRQREDVEADVVAELRIVCAEVAAVQPQLDVVQSDCADNPQISATRIGDREDEDLRPGGDDRAVGRQRIHLVGRHEHRPRPVGKQQRQEDRRPRPPTPAIRNSTIRLIAWVVKTSRIPDFAEPQPIDVDADELEPQDRQDDQADQRDQYPFGSLGHRGQSERGAAWPLVDSLHCAKPGCRRSGAALAFQRSFCRNEPWDTAGSTVGGRCWFPSKALCLRFEVVAEQ